MFIYALIISLAVLMIVLWPFLNSKNNLSLSMGASINSLERLEKMRKDIISRYVGSEEMVAKKDLSKQEWQTRKQYLTNRYLDVVHRIDYLQYENSLKQKNDKG